MKIRILHVAFLLVGSLLFSGCAYTTVDKYEGCVDTAIPLKFAEPTYSVIVPYGTDNTFNGINFPEGEGYCCVGKWCVDGLGPKIHIEKRMNGDSEPFYFTGKAVFESPHGLSVMARGSNWYFQALMKNMLSGEEMYVWVNVNGYGFEDEIDPLYRGNIHKIFGSNFSCENGEYIDWFWNDDWFKGRMDDAMEW
ncbi:MAG: hypothetical protein PF439_03790 [Helicobacteraceae bacterium]|nr:hypothetical protein [Helicobacteraceae bacterium]